MKKLSSNLILKSISALSLTFVLIAFVFLYINSSNYVARNVHFQDIDVAGMNYNQVEEIITNYVGKLNKQTILISTENQDVTLTPEEVGINFKVDKTIDKLFASGWSFWLKAQALIEEDYVLTVPPVSSVDYEKLRDRVQEILLADEKKYMNARLDWDTEEGWKIRRQERGRKINNGEIELAISRILKGTQSLDKNLVISSTYYPTEPTLLAGDLQELLEESKQLTNRAVQVVMDDTSEVIDLKYNSGKWLIIDYQNFEASYNTKEIIDFADRYAKLHDIRPGEIVIKDIEEFQSEYVDETYLKAVTEGDFRDGKKINQTKLIDDLTMALDNPSNIPIVIEYEMMPATVKSDVTGYDFSTKISVGKSDYSKGNYPNRVHNIKTALDFQDLTVIPAGEIFSYNKVLGWVSYGKGYVDGQVIFGNVSRAAAGGGVCQTSTTMFRAAVNAGLPIVDRRNHSWDVSYYQDWHGVDAAIYPPGKLDLKFVNDTPGPILVHSRLDQKNEFAYFDLYGIDDGRSVDFEVTQNTKSGRSRTIVTDWNVTMADGTVDNREIVSYYKK